MTIQFYRDDNTARVFNGNKMLFEMRDVIRPAICSIIGIPYRPSQWTKTEWGFEIELHLKPVKKAGKAER